MAEAMINLSNFDRRFERPLRDLPNIEGYRFIGVYPNGSREELSVIRDEQGLHRVEGGKFLKLRSWIEKPTSK